MAARNVSPGGALLRTSRMFSLPAAIPPPPNDGNSSTSFYSPTMTQAFPTRQIISTLSSARKQGDWGLKRPLPLRSTTKTTNPMLRVKAIDTIEQITDYASATDHGMTLRKYHELGLPITVRGASAHMDEMNIPTRSVFDEEVDVTNLDAEERVKAIDTRWRFTGPWLAGMTQGQFNKWLAKEVRPRRSEFREFLKKQLVSEKHAVAAQKALEKGQEPPALADPSSVTDDQLIDYLRQLRHNNQALYDMVGQFLDLAPLKPPTLAPLDTNARQKLQLHDVKNPWAESGPPITHPSAGLSYLRTSMYMENHPVYGPQKYHAPVVARVVRPRRQLQGTGARIGVAGFLAHAKMGDTAANTKGSRSDALDTIDPNLDGGAKVWVHANSARVDANGRVQLIAGDGTAEARLVAQELLGEAQILGVERKEAGGGGAGAGRRETAREIRQRFRARDPPAMSSARDYGLDQ